MLKISPLVHVFWIEAQFVATSLVLSRTVKDSFVAHHNFSEICTSDYVSKHKKGDDNSNYQVLWSSGYLPFNSFLNLDSGGKCKLLELFEILAASKIVKPTYIFVYSATGQYQTFEEQARSYLSFTFMETQMLRLTTDQQPRYESIYSAMSVIDEYMAERQLAVYKYRRRLQLPWMGLYDFESVAIDPPSFLIEDLKEGVI